MNTIGVGIDLVEVKRVEDMLERKGERVLEKLLTDRERGYCMRQAAVGQHVAARIAAKEAAYKSLQLRDDARAIGWRDIEVVRRRDGGPTIEFHGLAKRIAEECSVSRVLVSLSHTSSQAAGVVILLGSSR